MYEIPLFWSAAVLEASVARCEGGQWRINTFARAISKRSKRALSELNYCAYRSANVERRLRRQSSTATPSGRFSPEPKNRCCGLLHGSGDADADGSPFRSAHHKGYRGEGDPLTAVWLRELSEPLAAPDVRLGGSLSLRVRIDRLISLERCVIAHHAVDKGLSKRRSS
ncbi:hypothetical protein QAD02_014389 [Eretmocerus hayati]|uniref:Uncharacterized protein n=1 Tax=Eretmocerus hayati TaxID=131215 RepID=A0ACC2P5E5_9HYME|nr:hypothetical protein QAD02_014389 [Eretmocerus hayati]